MIGCYTYKDTLYWGAGVNGAWQAGGANTFLRIFWIPDIFEISWKYSNPYHEEGLSWSWSTSRNCVQELDSFPPFNKSFLHKEQNQFFLCFPSKYRILLMTFFLQKIPDHICEVISWVGILVDLWFAIDGQGVIVIPILREGCEKKMEKSLFFWQIPLIN